jgi:hypothetical protein
MTDDEKHRLRQAGREVGATLPPVSAETYRHIAELIRDPINTYVGDRRRKAGDAA